MQKILSTIFLILSLASVSLAEQVSDAPTLRIGFIGSLSGFAANYGNAVLEGVRLALNDLKQKGITVDLSVEDDASDLKAGVTAYKKLRAINKVQAIIAGTWWANAFVKLAEADNVPLLSCETLFNEDVVLGKTYFILQGDLADWVRVYDPLVAQKGFKRGAIVRFASGFGSTLEREMRLLFSKPGRSFVGAIEYSDIQAKDAGSFLLRLKRLAPDVVYVDMQPEGGAYIFKKMHELGLNNVSVLSHSALSDILAQGLIEPAILGEAFFTKREGYSAEFSAKFKNTYGREPILEADLGYYAMHLLKQALLQADALKALKEGQLSVDGKVFTFDANNVTIGPKEVIWQVVSGKESPWRSSIAQ